MENAPMENLEENPGEAAPAEQAPEVEAPAQAEKPAPEEAAAEPPADEGPRPSGSVKIGDTVTFHPTNEAAWPARVTAVHSPDLVDLEMAVDGEKCPYFEISAPDERPVRHAFSTHEVGVAKAVRVRVKRGLEQGQFSL